MNTHNNQFIKEIMWPTGTALFFSLIGTLTVLAWQNDYTMFYMEVDKYRWLYLPIYFALIMIIHETYYYRIHRLMHHSRIYFLIHKAHYNSKIPSTYTTFSIPPLEGVLQAIILPFLLLVIPIHYFVLMIYLFVMTFSCVINHLDTDIYPNGFENHLFGK